MKTVQEVLFSSTEFFTRKGLPRARRLAEELLSGALGIKRLDIYLQFDRPLIEAELVRCRQALLRLAKREPWQYVWGEVEFYECKIRVTSAVLIPRQETEILVDLVAQELSKKNLKGKVLWDICCGSGCIGIALKKKFPDLTVVLADISCEALSKAKENALLNQVEVELLQGDLLAPFEGKKGDFIVCNPPYIAEVEYAGLEPEVRNYEPRLALVAGPTGLEFYERLAKGLKRGLHSEGKGWFEIGSGQRQGIEHCFHKEGWGEPHFIKDWANHDRFFTVVP